MSDSVKKYIIPIFLSGFLKISEVLAQRGPVEETPGTLTNPLGTTDITVVLERIFQFLSSIGAPLLGIFIAIGGFQILTAMGDPQKIKTGKDTILYATIGYSVVLCAWGFIYIIKEVLGAK